MLRLKEGSLFHDRYLIKATLGAGGMGTVYRALQTDCSRVVALKLLKPDLVSSDEYFERFLREFRALSQLSHPNIVNFYNAAISDEKIPYAVYELLEGSTLGKIISDCGPLDEPRAIHFAIEICKGLKHIHEKSLVHRDLKPENVMISNSPEIDSVKVFDFGLSKDLSQTEVQKLTQTGELLGSVHYMSPEQCRGEKCGPAADVYALGCILFECLSGEHLYEAETPLGVIYAHINSNPSGKLKKLRVRCSTQTIALLSKMLAQSPDERPRDGAALLAEFDKVVKSLSGSKIDELDFRLKAFFANRISTLCCLVLLIALAGFFFANTVFWSAAKQAKASLLKDHSTTNLARLYLTAESLDPKQSRELQSMLDGTVSKLPPAEASALFVNLSEISKKNSRDEQSRKYAFRALEISADDVGKSRAKTIQNAVSALKLTEELFTPEDRFELEKIYSKLKDPELTIYLVKRLLSRVSTIDETPLFQEIMSYGRECALADEQTFHDVNAAVSKFSLRAVGPSGPINYYIDQANIIQKSDKVTKQRAKDLTAEAFALLQLNTNSNVQRGSKVKQTDALHAWSALTRLYFSLDDAPKAIFCARKALEFYEYTLYEPEAVNDQNQLEVILVFESLAKITDPNLKYALLKDLEEKQLVTVKHNGWGADITGNIRSTLTCNAANLAQMCDLKHNFDQMESYYLVCLENSPTDAEKQSSVYRLCENLRVHLENKDYAVSDRLFKIVLKFPIERTGMQYAREISSLVLSNPQSVPPSTRAYMEKCLARIPDGKEIRKIFPASNFSK